MIDDRTAWAAVPKGGWLETYAAWAWATSDAPMAYHLGTGLSVLSVAIPPYVEVHLGGRMLGHFWSMLIGEAGWSRKTTAGRKGYKILRDAAAEMCSTPSHESVAAFMEDFAERPQQLMFMGEYGDFLASTRDGSYKSDMRARLLSCWDGDPLEKKKQGETITVDDPRLSLLACVAPGLLERHTSEHDWTDGGMSRWVIYLAQRDRLLPNPPTLPERRQWLVEDLRRRLDLQIGPCVGIDDDAQALFADYQVKLEARVKGSRNRYLGPIYSRVASVVLKTALIAALDVGPARAAKGKPWMLDANSIRWGMMNAELHAVSAATLLQTLSMSPYARKLRSVEDAVSGGLRPYPEVLRRVLPPLPSREVDQILKSMQAAEQCFGVAVNGSPHTHYTLDRDEADAARSAIAREVATVTPPQAYPLVDESLRDRVAGQHSVAAAPQAAQFTDDAADDARAAAYGDY